MEYKYSLQRHGNVNVKGTKHTCPSCGEKNCFTYYTYWDKGVEFILDETCGRCDHQSRCGYHKTPRELFAENPKKRPKTEETSAITIIHPAPVPIITPDYIDSDFVIRSFSLRSNLVSFLWRIAPDHQRLLAVLQAYLVGATKNWEVVYWQIDSDWNVRTGKIIKYNPFDGHRIKRGGTDWVHSRMKRIKILAEDQVFNLKQCLFGEHLLRLFPELPVAIVESEKTALLCALAFPQYLWLATGGLYNMKKDMLKVLEGRTAVFIPDLEGYDLWLEKMKMLPQCHASILDILESHATAEDHEKKIDIGDIIVRILNQG